ncbi:glutamyl-tRNA synthetase [Mucilaginibacter terrae]|uniref:Glutamyl-tRNA synthetase n=1 Tax=Mucilaginibacter terrae TaxID=1955052 RepID=A0ABU3GWD8_9SPHI|nr:glutamyl-tRNA synthetase [Mucilaginibacter terrae]
MPKKLVMHGHAYYAFDTPEELEQKRNEVPNFQYGIAHRNQMRNSLSLPQQKVDKLLHDGTPHVIRIKMPENETITFEDMIRGYVSFDSNTVDDKVLLKADGMPTYHLAVVVDDYLMKISHAFRGDEWLPSAPVHLLLWEYLGWKDSMPQWAHLPLILKPDGHGKLSKRDGARLGFPVYAMNWTDAKTGDLTEGFREIGFLPEAFLNLLAMLGWNDGTDQEIFSLDELVEKFSMERISKAGAKFDFEKAKWYNAEWIKKVNGERLKDEGKAVLAAKGIEVSDDAYLTKALELIKDRLVLLNDIYEHAWYFFKQPAEYDLPSVKPKWNDAKTELFNTFIGHIKQTDNWNAADLEADFKALLTEKGLKPGDAMLPFRIMLVGGKFGPHVFDIAALLGKDEVIARIEKGLAAFTA